MPSAQKRGLAQTVLGLVQPSELGPTTTHEHLYIDFSFMYRPAQDSPSLELAEAPITLESLGWIRRNYYSNRFNITLMDPVTAIDEVRKYRELGGGAMVEATTVGIGRNPDVLARISQESGVHIIMGAGFYVDAVHPEDMDERSVEDLTRQIVAEIEQGVDGTGIKAGIIGEVGCTWPLTPNERKSLKTSFPQCVARVSWKRRLARLQWTTLPGYSLSPRVGQGCNGDWGICKELSRSEAAV